MAASTPELSVVVSTFGNYAGLRRVLDHLGAQTLEPSRFEVLVVVDAASPAPAAAETAIGLRPFAARILSGRIPGLSANRNAGWRAAAAPLVLFTDNDTPASPRLLAEHLAWHERHPEPEVAILGHVRWSREVRVSPFMVWLDHGIQFDYPSIEGTEAGWGRFYGANVSVKREFVEWVGGFDEVRFPYLYDDLDFARRARDHGLRVLYNRAAEVEHLREVDLRFWRDKVGRLARAERRFVEVHPDVEPYFFNLFSDAQRQPPASGRGRRLITWLPRSFPLLGERAWRSADIWFRQQIAPAFLAAWELGPSEDVTGSAPVAPYLLRHRASRSSTGSEPSGPK